MDNTRFSRFGHLFIATTAADDDSNVVEILVFWTCRERDLAIKISDKKILLKLLLYGSYIPNSGENAL